MKNYVFGNTFFTEDQLLSSKIITQKYISGFDDSKKPDSGFFKKLFYKPEPIYSEADFCVIRYRLPENNYHIRSGVIHRTDTLCLCRDKAAYEAIRSLAQKCKNDYEHAPNEKRTRLERSEEFHDLECLGLTPSLINEPDDDDSRLAQAWASSRGGNFITYSFLLEDFDDFADRILMLYEEDTDFPVFPVS